jgi:hypothetical protein
MLPRLARSATVLGTGLLLLAGCGAPLAKVVTPESIPAGRPVAQSMLLSFLQRRAAPPARDTRASWVSPAAKAQNLVYVSSGGSDQVFMYSFPAGAPAGTLSSLEDPAGVCSDAAGDVWVVESASPTIMEYAHAATKHEATLTFSGVNPLGCAVDPTTGNLAVTNLGTASGGGGFSIYTGAKGSAKKYVVSGLAYAYFCAYDNQGNLFVDGLSNSYSFALVELPSGSQTAQKVGLSGSIGYPGGVAWDGEYLAIGDQYYQGKHKAAIFQYSVSGSAGTLEGTTPLADSCDALQFAISSGGTEKKKAQQGNTAVVPDTCLNTAGLYSYPAGGNPSDTLTGLQYPVAAAVSLAQ